MDNIDWVFKSKAKANLNTNPGKIVTFDTYVYRDNVVEVEVYTEATAVQTVCGGVPWGRGGGEGALRHRHIPRSGWLDKVRNLNKKYLKLQQISFVGYITNTLSIFFVKYFKTI